MRLLMLLSVLALVGCGGNRTDEGAVVDTTGGRVFEAPDDSVRLEDTLSMPPPSDSVR